MLTQAKILSFIGPVLLVLLTAIAGYTYTQTRLLSLPIPQGLTLMTVLLPLVAGLSTRTIQLLIHPSTSPNSSTPTKPTLAISAILTCQLIYETVTMTLALVYFTPSTIQSCSLSEQWKTMFRSKDERGIRRIQEAFQCCGLNSARDMPWPFPTGSIAIGECQRRLGSDRSCYDSWRSALRRDSGLLFMVGLVVFILKVVAVSAILNSLGSRIPRWMRAFHYLRDAIDSRDEEEDPRSAMRGLIDNGTAVESESTSNGAHVEDQDRAGDNDRERPRIEPSPLLGSQHIGEEGWGDGRGT